MSKNKKSPNLPEKIVSKKGSGGKQTNDASLNRASRRRNSILISIIVVILMVAIISIGMALSWFSPGEEADLTVITTDFETQTLYAVSAEPDESDFAELTDEISFSVDEFEDLHLNIKYTGPSSAYIRVQLFESFYTLNGETKVMQPAADINYTLGADWVKIGDYYYYKNVVTYTEAEETENGKSVKKRNPTEITFVTSASSKYDDVADSGVSMNLVAVVEAVQPDRFQEFFGADPEWLFANN